MANKAATATVKNQNPDDRTFHGFLPFKSLWRTTSVGAALTWLTRAKYIAF